MSKTAAEYIDINELKPWDKNPRKNDHAVSEVKQSIERFGFSAPIIARKSDNVIIAGHTRWKAAKEIGLKEVPVRFMDLDVVDSQLLAIADNKLNERADWDEDLLEQVLQDLAGEDLSGIGFDDNELQDIIDKVSDTEPKEENEDLPELEEEVHSKEGEIYELGLHRLLCGDSTKKENWDLLLDGEKVDMVFTDPPYGVSLGFNMNEEQAKILKKRTDNLTIQNDDLTGEKLELFLEKCFTCLYQILKAGGAIYVACPPSPNLKYYFEKPLLELNLVRHSLVWIKHTFAFGRSDYHYQHEDILYGWKEGAAHYFIDDHSKSTTLHYDKPSRNPIHPTMKPIELIEELIKNSSRRKEIIADAFGGSGSTLIAADKQNRYARLIELDPKYCDAIRRRWTRYATENGLEIGSGGLE